MNSPGSAPNPEAVRFVTDLVTNVALLRGYATVLDTVAASTDKDTKPIDDFLQASGYKATVDEVAAAEAVVEANQIAYWCGVYSTQFVDQQGTKTGGPLLTISPQASGPVRIGYGNQWLIAPVFSGGQLVWLKADNDGTPLNDTAGSFLFSLSSQQSGGVTRTFTGTLTQADGTQTQIVGVQSDITPAPGSTPPGQDLEVLKTVAMLVTAAVGVVGLTTVLVTYRKSPLEMQKLQLEVDQLRRAAQENVANVVRQESQPVVVEAVQNLRAGPEGQGGGPAGVDPAQGGQEGQARGGPAGVDPAQGGQEGQAGGGPAGVDPAQAGQEGQAGGVPAGVDPAQGGQDGQAGGGPAGFDPAQGGQEGQAGGGPAGFDPALGGQQVQIGGDLDGLRNEGEI